MKYEFNECYSILYDNLCEKMSTPKKLLGGAFSVNILHG